MISQQGCCFQDTREAFGDPPNKGNGPLKFGAPIVEASWYGLHIVTIAPTATQTKSSELQNKR